MREEYFHQEIRRIRLQFARAFLDLMRRENASKLGKIKLAVASDVTEH